MLGQRWGGKRLYVVVSMNLGDAVKLCVGIGEHGSLHGAEDPILTQGCDFAHVTASLDRLAGQLLR